jgi:hypothetical protein
MTRILSVESVGLCGSDHGGSSAAYVYFERPKHSGALGFFQDTFQFLKQDGLVHDGFS